MEKSAEAKQRELDDELTKLVKGVGILAAGLILAVIGNPLWVMVKLFVWFIALVCVAVGLGLIFTAKHPLRHLVAIGLMLVSAVVLAAATRQGFVLFLAVVGVVGYGVKEFLDKEF